MSFDVAADAYARFMGRYADPLAELFVDLVLDVGRLLPDDRVLDVGCGPGTVTAVLAGRLGSDRVAAVDPSPALVSAARDRFTSVEVHEASAEDLPFGDAEFGAAVAQLVVPFMADPVRGLSEMRRVVRPGGAVAACAWDAVDGPLAAFWREAEALDPGAASATDLPGAGEGRLPALMRAAGLHDVHATTLEVHVEVPTFEEWWSPFAYGIGPAGEYFASLTAAQQDALRTRCATALSEEPIGISGWAHAAVARRG